ncbi:hypothetical protein LCDVSa009L [Lymphocystis disease virus 3]|uniref:Uncharacterized protein n=1 Tax=Lymphocystis disease virus 3 TaxID=2560566 RepID=A0A1B2RVR3_9VIRU|nr:hypothetical protein BZK12_gp009 [Lymphocystis disease virus Sa]AOC55093.1 hypothetical protein LCDVSa009L [Lymphocystis disease virus 3]
MYSLECGKLSRVFKGLNKTKTVKFILDFSTNNLESYYEKNGCLFKSLSDYEIRIVSSVDFNRTLLNNDPSAIPLTRSELTQGLLDLKSLISSGKLGALFKKHDVFFLFDETEFDQNYESFLSNVRLVIFSSLIKLNCNR